MEASRDRTKAKRGKRDCRQSEKSPGRGFFLLVMALSFYTVFHGQDMGQIRQAMSRLSPAALFAAMCTALFFVSAEGIMIHYLFALSERAQRLKKVYRLFLYRLFLFGDHAFGHGRAADAAVLYDEGP